MNEEVHDLVGGPFAVIESDPGVFTSLVQLLGTRGLEVVELYDIEPWAVDHLNPHGLIFCYLCPNNDEASDYDDLDDQDSDEVWFANQLSNDACASQAILNVLLNCPSIELGSQLHEIKITTQSMTPVMRGLALSSSHFIREAHNSLARPADLRGAVHAVASATVDEAKAKAKAADSLPSKRRKTSSSASQSRRKAQYSDENEQDAYHYIGYVPAHNKVWELDGLRSSPIEVGELLHERAGDGSSRTVGWMDVVRPALKMRMQRYMEGSDHIQYNLLAIVDDNYQKASDKLEMLKRERNALERRLQEAYPEGWSDKVDHTLLASAADAFSTSVRPAADGRVFRTDFGAEKMQKEISILDMPTRSVPAAWEACISAALTAKVAVEEEIAKSRQTHSDHIKRTFDYEPFIMKFITCMQEEGRLDGAMHNDPDGEVTTATSATSARSKGRRK